MEPRPKSEPTQQELTISRAYFHRLQDALFHYANTSSAKINFETFGTEYKGFGTSVVSDSRFPPLDNLVAELDRVGFAAGRLDLLPTTFWNQLWEKFMSKQSNMPVISRQIYDWGSSNIRGGIFTSQAEGYSVALRSLGWTRLGSLNHYPDYAEQAYMMLDSYLVLKGYFNTNDLPKGINRF